MVNGQENIDLRSENTIVKYDRLKSALLESKPTKVITVRYDRPQLFRSTTTVANRWIVRGVMEALAEKFVEFDKDAKFGIVGFDNSGIHIDNWALYRDYFEEALRNRGVDGVVVHCLDNGPYSYINAELLRKVQGGIEFCGSHPHHSTLGLYEFEPYKKVKIDQTISKWSNLLKRLF